MPDPAESPVLAAYDPATGIGRITFNRPDVLNAIDVPTALAFRDAVLGTVAEAGLRCVVLAGAGRAFVAGGDLAALSVDVPGGAASTVHAILDAVHPALLALRACPAPVLAAVQGVAAGAGLSLVLGADLVLASERARFVIAYDKVGAPPDCGGTWFLPRVVGRTRAFELMLLGQALDAEAARQAGIVSEVVPEAGLQARVEEVSHRVASGPTAAYGRFKRLVDDAFGTSLAQHLEAERAAFVASTETADFREGVAAFLAKRDPVFRGR